METDTLIKTNKKNAIKILVILRHGESVWNKENLFSGWTDVDLSGQGKEEVRKAGVLLKEKGFTFDVAFTSLLKRAIRSLWIVLDEMDLMWIPVYKNWRLNERYYGALQGLNKSETAKKFGEEQVNEWRRSYDIRPPALETDDPRHPSHDPRYNHLLKEQLPATECLKDTVARFLPYWHDHIAPELLGGKIVLIVAHGNSIRAVIKYLDKVSDTEITTINIPTGIPLVYELDEELQPIRHYYLGDEDAVQKAIETVANQASVKH